MQENNLPFKPLTGQYDKSNCHLSIYPGVGGDDAKDWADMLMTMYVKYAAKRGFKAHLIDERSLEIQGAAPEMGAPRPAAAGRAFPYGTRKK